MADVAAFVCGSFPSSRTAPSIHPLMPALPSLAAAHMAGLAGWRQPTP